MKIECSTGEIVYTYKEYMKTKHWTIKKKQFAEKTERKCTICGTTENLNVHHMTYENIGKEKSEDLVYLCSDCHKFIHKNLDKMKDQSFFTQMKSIIKKGRKLKAIKTTCKGCIHTKKGSKARCDLGYDYSTKIEKHCKRYAKNDYVYTPKEKEEIANFNLVREQAIEENKNKADTDYIKLQKQKALEKRRKYL